MKIKLILAASEFDPLKKNEPFMPLSLPLIAATVPDHDYTLINMLANDKINFDEPVDLVGISSRITAEKKAYQIADEFRKRKVKVVLGGPQMSAMPFRAKEHADSVVVGEGEELWPVLLKDLKNNKLKDFYVSSPNKFDAKYHSVFQIYNYANLKNIPIASRSLFKKKYMFDTVFAVRGCSIDCDFCSVSSFFGKKARFRPIDEVVKEISGFKSFFYYLLDDNVFGRPAFYDYYIELYEKLAKLKKIRYWTGQATLEAASTQKGREVIKKAAKAGLIYAAIGMESINPIVQKKSGIINKMGVHKSKDLVTSMKENIKFIQSLGIIVTGWFTIGYEEDEIDTFYKTLEFCRENNVIPIISALEALNGTRLYDRLLKEGKIDDNKKINIIHPNMTDDKIIKALKDITKKAFSLKSIIRNTFFYSRKFKKNHRSTGKNIQEKIFKTIFTFILQKKLKVGVISYANDETFLNEK